MYWSAHFYWHVHWLFQSCNRYQKQDFPLQKPCWFFPLMCLWTLSVCFSVVWAFFPIWKWNFLVCNCPALLCSPLKTWYCICHLLFLWYQPGVSNKLHSTVTRQAIPYLSSFKITGWTSSGPADIWLFFLLTSGPSFETVSPTHHLQIKVIVW